MTHRIKYIFLLTLFPSTIFAQSEGLILRNNFNGFDRTFGGGPPDITIAVGPSSIVLCSNDALVIKSKDGNQIAIEELNRFFDSVRRKPREKLIDPTVAYDPWSNRFFLAACGAYRDDPNCTLGSCVANLLLAVSKNPYPTTFTTEDWYFYTFDATLEGTTRTTNFPDHVRIGVDDKVVVLVADMATFLNLSNRHPLIRILDKSKLIQGQAVSWIDLVGMKNPDGNTAQQFVPAIHHESNPSGIFFLISQPTGANCALLVWGIENPLSAPVLSSRVLTPVSLPGPGIGCWQGPDAPQPGNAPPLFLSELPTLRYPCMLRNGSLWVSQQFRMNFGGGDVTAIRWVQINVARWPGSVSLVQDSFFGADKMWYFHPSLAVDSSNNVAIVYGRSSTSEFPSVYFTGRLGTDPPNTLRTSQLLKAGEASQNAQHLNFLGRQLYGDYFGAAVDPVNGSIWLVGEYVKTPEIWGTWVGNIVFEPTPTVIDDNKQGIPYEFQLSQNYPNPFNPSTIILYQLPKALHVSLRIYNVLGQEVATLVDEEKEAGFYQVEWRPNLASGIYFYRIEAGEFVQTKKLLLLR